MLRFMSRQGHKRFRLSEGSGVAFPAERTLAGTDNLRLRLPFGPKFYSDRSAMAASAVLHHASPTLGHPNNNCCVIVADAARRVDRRHSKRKISGGRKYRNFSGRDKKAGCSTPNRNKPLGKGVGSAYHPAPE